MNGVEKHKRDPGTRPMPGGARAWRDQRIPAFEQVAISIHERLRGRPIPTVDELRASPANEPASEVMDRLSKTGEAADRRLSVLVTGSAFLVALAGAPIATAQDSPGLFAPAAVLALGAFLIAIRGVGRRVDGIPGVPPTWRDVEAARNALAAKSAWNWVAGQLLRLSAGWLLLLTVLLSLD